MAQAPGTAPGTTEQLLGESCEAKASGDSRLPGDSVRLRLRVAGHGSLGATQCLGISPGHPAEVARATAHGGEVALPGEDVAERLDVGQVGAGNQACE